MSEVGLDYINSSTKRGLDIVGGLVIATALSPAIIPATIAAQVDNRRINPFFRQKRVGTGERLIDVWKLRTLHENLTRGELTFHGTYDPRATKIGQFLRSTGLDEWPQLIDVIAGDTSLVGLRSVSVEELDDFKEASPALFTDWYPLQETLKTSLTGISQLFRRSTMDHTPQVLAKSMELDIGYAEHVDLRMDLSILAATPHALIMSALNGRKTVQEIPST